MQLHIGQVESSVSIARSIARESESLAFRESLLLPESGSFHNLLTFTVLVQQVIMGHLTPSQHTVGVGAKSFHLALRADWRAFHSFPAVPPVYRVTDM